MVSLTKDTQKDVVSKIELVAPFAGLPVDQTAVNSVTRGLVGDTSFAVLPEITPETTFALTLLFQIVSPGTSTLKKCY